MKKGNILNAGKKIMDTVFLIVVLGLVAAVFINAYIKYDTDGMIKEKKEAAENGDYDCILVLGCSVRPDGTPSMMLEDRLRMGIELYYMGAAKKILMSGDHGRKEYNEVGKMKEYTEKRGIPAEDIFMDHAGFSTYDSIYRAKEIFGVEKVLIVTHKYHLYRALYIAEKLGLDAEGVYPEYNSYEGPGQEMRDRREELARIKDFMMTIIKPEPRFLGDVIPISGSGELTDD